MNEMVRCVTAEDRRRKCKGVSLEVKSIADLKQIEEDPDAIRVPPEGRGS
jgi:hypothetical protein